MRLKKLWAAGNVSEKLVSLTAQPKKCFSLFLLALSPLASISNIIKVISGNPSKQEGGRFRGMTKATDEIITPLSYSANFSTTRHEWELIELIESSWVSRKRKNKLNCTKGNKEKKSHILQYRASERDSDCAQCHWEYFSFLLLRRLSEFKRFRRDAVKVLVRFIAKFSWPYVK